MDARLGKKFYIWLYFFCRIFMKYIHNVGFFKNLIMNVIKIFDLKIFYKFD